MGAVMNKLIVAAMAAFSLVTLDLHMPPIWPLSQRKSAGRPCGPCIQLDRYLFWR